MDIDEISGNIEKNPGKFLSTLSILHNNERQFGFDTTIVSEIGQGVSKVFQTVTCTSSGVGYYIYF